MKEKPLNFHAKKFVAIARNFYERGFVVFAFLTMLIAFALAEPVSSGRPSLTAETESSGASQQLSARNPQWLSRQAELLTRKLMQSNIRNAVVYHRVKSRESAEQKARRQHKSVEALNDLYGMRVVVDNELDVYRCLNEICSCYDIIPGTMKNYIANPKASGYQSIHVVAGIDNRRVEFQLRTRAMHAQSEAEHEAYKARMAAA